MVYRGRQSRLRVQQRYITTKRPNLTTLDISSVHDDYDSYTMLLRVMLRLTDANNAAAEIFSYAAFKPCISVLMSTLSRTIASPQACFGNLAVEGHELASAETVIDIDARPISNCVSDPNTTSQKSCVRAHVPFSQDAHFSKLSEVQSMDAHNRTEREFGAMSRSDTVFLLGVVICFLLAAKLIAQASTLHIAGSMKWYHTSTRMQI